MELLLPLPKTSSLLVLIMSSVNAIAWSVTR